MEGSFRFASLGDVSDVVKVHIRAFPHFFLTRLGAPFLYAFYSGMLRYPSCIFLVHETPTCRIAGFVVGTTKKDISDLRMLLNVWTKSIFCMLPALARHPCLIVQRIADRVTGRTSFPRLNPNTMIVHSIAVDPEFSGRGIGSSLLELFEVCAQNKSIQEIALTTDEANNAVAQHFYQRHGFRVSARFSQNNRRWMWLMTKSVNPTQ